MNPLWTLLPPLLVIPFILYFGEARKNLREGAIIIAGIILLLLNVKIYNDFTGGEVAESGSFPILADYSLKLSVEPMLVTHAGNADAKKGGRIYLGILMASSIGLLLPAIVWTATAANTLDFTAGGVLGSTGMSRGAMAILLALFTFGIAKAAVMPLHRWLPAAMVAPTPVSALLHAVAVVKTGVFSLLKIVTYTFGIDSVASTGAATWILPIVAFTIIASSIVAFTKDNLKARLAYSTISQLSYIVLAALLATTLSISGGVAHIVMHAFGKITLFFCAGAILVALHKKMPITMAAFFIGAISIIGLPPTAGSWSKLMIAGGSFDGGTMFWALVLMLSTLLNICYLLPIPMRAFLKPLPDGASAERQEAPFASLCAIVITASFCLLLFFNPQPLVELIGMIQWR